MEDSKLSKRFNFPKPIQNLDPLRFSTRQYFKKAMHKRLKK